MAACDKGSSKGAANGTSQRRLGGTSFPCLPTFQVEAINFRSDLRLPRLSAFYVHLVPSSHLPFHLILYVSINIAFVRDKITALAFFSITHSLLIDHECLSFPLYVLITQQKISASIKTLFQIVVVPNFNFVCR